MTAKHMATELFRRRLDASRTGYFVALSVIVFFILLGHDEPLTEMLPYYAVLLICIFQLGLRTLAGWLFLLALSGWYALDVATHPGHVDDKAEYAFLIACGAIPALALLVFRPRTQRVRN
jgi:hypothetical protein